MAIVYAQNDPELFQKLKKHGFKDCVFVSPTDTVYGIGAVYGNDESLRRIALIKNRPNTFIVLVNSIEKAEQIVEISPEQKKTLKSYWPGPITFTLNKKDGTGTLAVRNPSNPFLNNLMSYFDCCLYSTSCNLPGQPTVKTLKEAEELFGDVMDFYIDGGTANSLTPSTLVDLTQDPPKILRQGPIQWRTNVENSTV